MTIDMLKPLVEITVTGKKVVVRVENLKGKEVLKLLPALKQFGKVQRLPEIVRECREAGDRNVSFSFCG